MCGAFAGAFPAKSGTHDAPVITVGFLSRLLSPIVTNGKKVSHHSLFYMKKPIELLGNFFKLSRIKPKGGLYHPIVH
jgi:hypothetical protein